MKDETPSESSCYVFDTSSLIEIEHNHHGLKHMPDKPGKWLVVPSKVAREVNSEGAPADTKNWLNSGKFATFTVDTERRLFMEIRRRERLLSDADIEGIVISHHRKGTYVVEEKLATSVAQTLGITTLKAVKFMHKVTPHLPGF